MTVSTITAEDIINEFNDKEIKDALRNWAREYKNQFGETFDEKKRDEAFNTMRKFEQNDKVFAAIVKIQNILLRS